MTPEEDYKEAVHAINLQQWDRATAHATAGLLSLAIGAMQALVKVYDD